MAAPEVEVFFLGGGCSPPGDQNGGLRAEPPEAERFFLMWIANSAALIF